MKAIVFDRFGGPEVLQLRDVPDPAPKADEVVVEVKACGINHLDLWVRQGLRGLDPEMPHILGNDVVGVARDVGSAVRHVKPGDRVLVCPTLSCGVCPPCLAGASPSRRASGAPPGYRVSAVARPRAAMADARRPGRAP